jgi:cardiolipin synthase
MNIPNYLTLLRIILIPFFIDLLMYGYYREALLVFLAACVTDGLDGLLARLMNQKSELGAFLDPMADKLLILSAFVTLAYLGKLPVWLVIIVVSRDVILTMGSLIVYFTTDTLEIRPSIIGKATTVAQFSVVTLSLILMSYRSGIEFMAVLQLTTGVITIISGAQYVARGVKLVG